MCWCWKLCKRFPQKLQRWGGGWGLVKIEKDILVLIIWKSWINCFVWILAVEGFEWFLNNRRMWHCSIAMGPEWRPNVSRDNMLSMFNAKMKLLTSIMAKWPNDHIKTSKKLIQTQEIFNKIVYFLRKLNSFQWELLLTANIKPRK